VRWAAASAGLADAPLGTAAELTPLFRLDQLRGTPVRVDAAELERLLDARG
jgi:hypothetical protein